MPRTVFDKYAKPRPNYLAEYLRVCRKAKGLTYEGVGRLTNESLPTVYRKLTQYPEKWKVGDLKLYCSVVGAEYPEALRLCGQ